jgi:hypothetical protein
VRIRLAPEHVREHPRAREARVQLANQPVQAFRDVARHHDPGGIDLLVGKPFDERGQQLGLTPEVVVHQAFRHVGAFGDTGRRRGVETGFGEQFLGREENASYRHITHNLTSSPP